MFSSLFSDVHIECFGMHLPEYQLSTLEIEDRLAPIYKKHFVPAGTLEKLSGISSRGIFSEKEKPSDIATKAAKDAIEDLGFEADHIGAIFNCSVTRDYFEPATSVIVHKNLGFEEKVMAMDITNACIGFSNGMLLMANMIQSGVIKAGLICSGENMVHITDGTFKRLLEGESVGRKEFIKTLPTFTLGSGAVAMVLCHSSIATRTHRLVGLAARSASQHMDLCIGNGDFCFMQDMGIFPLMDTDSKRLISSAAKLGSRTWQDASEVLHWSKDDINHIFCHQVGKQVNGNFYDTVGLPIEKEYTVYQTYGNLVSAALPSALITGAREGLLKQGDKALLMGFGSGLNSIFSGIEW